MYIYISIYTLGAYTTYTVYIVFVLVVWQWQCRKENRHSVSPHSNTLDAPIFTPRKLLSHTHLNVLFARTKAYIILKRRTTTWHNVCRTYLKYKKKNKSRWFRKYMLNGCEYVTLRLVHKKLMFSTILHLPEIMYIYIRNIHEPKRVLIKMFDGVFDVCIKANPLK